jgi:hypothetical protein
VRLLKQSAKLLVAQRYHRVKRICYKAHHLSSNVQRNALHMACSAPSVSLGMLSAIVFVFTLHLEPSPSLLVCCPAFTAPAHGIAPIHQSLTAAPAAHCSNRRPPAAAAAAPRLPCSIPAQQPTPGALRPCHAGSDSNRGRSSPGEGLELRTRAGAWRVGGVSPGASAYWIAGWAKLRRDPGAAKTLSDMRCCTDVYAAWGCLWVQQESFDASVAKGVAVSA